MILAFNPPKPKVPRIGRLLRRDFLYVCSTHVVASEVVDIGLGKHGVVLELGLSQGRSIASDDNELGLAGSKGLEGGLVTECDCAVVSMDSSLIVCLDVAPLPDFITSARRELMLSAVFLAFFGAIFARYSVVLSRKGLLCSGEMVVFGMRTIMRSRTFSHFGSRNLGTVVTWVSVRGRCGVTVSRFPKMALTEVARPCTSTRMINAGLLLVICCHQHRYQESGNAFACSSCLKVPSET